MGFISITYNLHQALILARSLFNDSAIKGLRCGEGPDAKRVASSAYATIVTKAEAWIRLDKLSDYHTCMIRFGEGTACEPHFVSTSAPAVSTACPFQPSS